MSTLTRPRDVPDTSPAEVVAAVSALATSFAATLDGPASWPDWQRRESLSRAADLLAERHELFTGILSSEGCKTVRDAGAEVSRAIETMRLSSAAVDALTGGTVPFGGSPRGAERIGWTTREPLGVVAVKPHEATPLSALALAEVLLDAGVPADRLAVLPGGPETGRALVTHPAVDVVSFTGGTATGDAVARGAGARTLLMELGGSSAVLVDRGSDLAAVATAVADGAFGCAGQNCLSVQRVYVHDDDHAELVRKLVDATGRLVVGPRRDPLTDVGPMLDEATAVRVERRIHDAVARGARVRAGGRRTGAVVEPTVLTDVDPGDPIVTEEIFGPVVSVIPVTGLDQAVRLANRGAGLQAGLFTRDVTSALRTARGLRVGAVMINDTSDFRIDAMPFGGFHRTGVGREGVISAALAMTAPKVVAAHLAPHPACAPPTPPRPYASSSTP